MNNKLLGLVFLATTLGLAAQPLTFTFEEYQVDAVSVKVGLDYPLEKLEGMKPTFSQSVELSAEGNGKAVTIVGGSTITTDVHDVPAKDSLYQIELKHEYVALISEGIPIISSRGVQTERALKVGDRAVIGAMKTGSDGEEDIQSQAYIFVVKLTV